jgi:hypothetical protein
MDDSERHGVTWQLNSFARGAWLWPVLGIPLAMVAGLLWAMVVRSCGKVLDDFGGEVPPLSAHVLGNVWPWAIMFVLVSSACLLIAAVSTTAKGALAARLAILLVAVFYLLIAVLACVPPLLKLASDLN